VTDVAQEAGQDYPPEREVGEVAISEEMAPAGPANHPSASRRQRIQAITNFFKPVVVPQGTQQAEAILTVRDRARVMALTIEERMPDGAEKDHALKAVAEAMFWANQGISHRGLGPK
jgi:hypothetical protein